MVVLMKKRTMKILIMNNQHMNLIYISIPQIGKIIQLLYQYLSITKIIK